MKGPFVGKRVLLGVTGSIAAYKAADLASQLTQAGAQVDVLMTRAAQHFVGPMTFRGVTHRPVVIDCFDIGAEEAVEHIALARAADIMIVAPGTANSIAKMAWGLADDPVSITALATEAPVVVAPAMDGAMWGKQSTVDAVEGLRAQGYHVAGPARGRLASGLEGWGRMLEVPDLMGHLALVLGRRGDLAGRRIVVSAGGTREEIDPVRVISNRSSGKMGYAIAEAARDRGALVQLVSSAGLPTPVGVRLWTVESYAEMRASVLEACFEADVLVMAAAVADFRPAGPSARKLKKGRRPDGISLDLVPNADFFRDVPEGVLRVGFAAESEELLANAQSKLEDKGLALIAANDITQANSGFGSDTNQVTLIDREGGIEELPLLPKYDVAQCLLDRVRAMLEARDAAQGGRPDRVLP